MSRNSSISGLKCKPSSLIIIRSFNWRLCLSQSSAKSCQNDRTSSLDGLASRFPFRKLLSKLRIQYVAYFPSFVLRRDKKKKRWESRWWIMSKKFENPIKGCRGTHKNQHSNICSGLSFENKGKWIAGTNRTYFCLKIVMPLGIEQIK